MMWNWIKQRGYHFNYPIRAKCWKMDLNEKMPSWFTDHCWVEKIDGLSGLYKLRTLKNTDGSLSIMGVNNTKLVTVPKDGFIISDDLGNFWGLTRNRLDMLYEFESEGGEN